MQNNTELTHGTACSVAACLPREPRKAAAAQERRLGHRARAAGAAAAVVTVRHLAAESVEHVTLCVSKWVRCARARAGLSD